MEPTPTLFSRVRRIFLGKARSPDEKNLFHTLSLIAFFAWVGLGADGLSSLAYGPEEAYVTLGAHQHLSVFVALATAITVFVISAGYSQLIEAFPTGGGGYLVASKLLSPTVGMVSGCALLVDYVLTITISVASGADALFSFMPEAWVAWKLHAAVVGVLLLVLLNLRGVKESVQPLVPVFMTFVLTHLFVILYALLSHAGDLPRVLVDTGHDFSRTASQLGWLGVFVLMLKAYSMGAGTYTGIEAVSNGLQILREPRVQTGRRTMRYMSISLALGVMGLMLAYLVFDVRLPLPDEHGVVHKTLNAVLFENLTATWGRWGDAFVFVTLASEAVILFIAAQAGFLGGPQILANMALDSWIPKRYATLSDRFVTHNGVLLMGGAALVTMILTGGSVKFLVILYAINVFITFVLSQAGMVRYWWTGRAHVPGWRKKLVINGVGLGLTAFILVSIVILKFHEGAWLTLAVTGLLALGVYLIKRHYLHTSQLLKRLDGLVRVAEPTRTPPPAGSGAASQAAPPAPANDPAAKTAVLLVNGFTGVGLHTLFSVIRLFGGVFKNFVFVQIGAIDAGVFKGAEEIDSLRRTVQTDVERYVAFMNANGYYAEGLSAVSVDIVQEATRLAPQIIEKFPQSVFFGGQLVFPRESLIIRWLHNYTVFALQRKFYHRGIPFVILPIRV